MLTQHRRTNNRSRSRMSCPEVSLPSTPPPSITTTTTIANKEARRDPQPVFTFLNARTLALNLYPFPLPPRTAAHLLPSPGRSRVPPPTPTRSFPLSLSLPGPRAGRQVVPLADCAAGYPVLPVQPRLAVRCRSQLLLIVGVVGAVRAQRHVGGRRRVCATWPRQPRGKKGGGEGEGDQKGCRLKIEAKGRVYARGMGATGRVRHSVGWPK